MSAQPRLRAMTPAYEIVYRRLICNGANSVTPEGRAAVDELVAYAEAQAAQVEVYAAACGSLNLQALAEIPLRPILEAYAGVLVFEMTHNPNPAVRATFRDQLAQVMYVLHGTPAAEKAGV